MGLQAVLKRTDRCHGCGHDRDTHCYGVSNTTCGACSREYGHETMHHRICREFVETPDETWTRLQWPAPWEPKPGDSIDGVYCGIQRVGHKEERQLVHVRSSAGLFSIDSEIVKNLLSRNAIRNGARVRVSYVGEKTSPVGNKYKEFTVDLEGQ